MFSFLFLIFSIISIRNTNCSINIARIYGGSKVDIEHAKHQVSIQVQANKLLHTCGGSLISPNLVLTAAHCFMYDGKQQINENHMVIVAGVTNVYGISAFSSYATSMVIHKGYDDKTMENDIALIKLILKVPENSRTMASIRLAQVPVPTNTLCTITGWGYTEKKQSESNELLQVSVFIKNFTTCYQLFRKVNIQIMSSMLCAGSLTNNTMADACIGDSGGALVCDGLLTGIISQGHPDKCGKLGFPGIYTDVLKFQEWILHNSELLIAGSFEISWNFLLTLCAFIIAISQ